jgi:prepilin-type N-terminal cleavage/methylation domain-containing protein
MKKHNGFSLIEIAVVLIIISVLFAMIAIPLATQIDLRRTEDTQRQLEAIKEALIGYAVANGRLPCPAIATSNGNEAFAAGGNATNGNCQQFVGFLPAATLGLSPVDANGFALDAWGLTQNRIRYGVSALASPSGTPATCINAIVTNVFTRTDGMRLATMACLADTNPSLNMLRICSSTPTGAAGAATGCTSLLTTKAPFVLLSLGKNAATGGIDTDEAHNVDTDAYFVSHTPTPAGSANGEFDDVVTWGSLSALFARMVQAGRLP